MTNSPLEENIFFNFIKNDLHEQLLRWVEPNWMLCIPQNFNDIKLTSILAASQALCRSEKNLLQYHSELCGSSITYEICDEDTRKIIWQEEKNDEVIISQTIILDEYLTPIGEHVVHVLLVDRLLPSMIEDDQYFMIQNEPKSISSIRVYIVDYYHDELWNHIVHRCHVVDKMVSTRINYLKSCGISPLQLGLPTEYCAPLPAAIVELASLNARTSALERLHCIQDSLELVEAQTKEAKAMVYQFKDDDSDSNFPLIQLTIDDLIGLMTVTIIEAQCLSLVANIYYMTHYIFSVNDETHPLWQSLNLFRKCLEKIMKLDISSLPNINPPLRKELSLQDLMQVSAIVESRFESPQNIHGSHSVSDITALDLQLQHLTEKIAQSTQALSESTLSERNSPSRRSDGTATKNCTINQRKTQSFIEFLSSIPSTIRASFRRRQSEQRTAIYSSIEN